MMLTIWFITLFASLCYVTWHNLYHNPASWVQKLAWILVTAYTGVVGLIAYCLACRTRTGMSHQESTKEAWKQGLNSEMHCLAGDATGIIVSAAIVYHFGLPNGLDLIFEYIAAFLFGLLIFQALMMISMFHGNYFLAVKKTVFAETVSMNMVMLGMIPVMVILMHWIPDADNPWNPNFWFVMGMATIAGGVTAFPINYWLIKKGLKHGCMTLEAEPKEHHHQMETLSLPRQILWVIFTFAILFGATYLTTFFAPISFR